MNVDSRRDTLQDTTGVEKLLEAVFTTLPAPTNDEAPTPLVAAMRYSLLAGGKRLRPLLVAESARAVSTTTVRPNAVEPAMSAIEMIHTYSLIHDDLPCMDNDDMRRGKPTCHRAFDEATALLAGDALLTDAFAVLARAPTNAAAQVRELADAAGSGGMVGGQMLDMIGESRALSLPELESVHRRKTGCLFAAACALGAIAVDANDADIDALRTFGYRLGLAFQIADDILDVEGDPKSRGKKTGGDVERSKSTYVSLLGLEVARTRSRETSEAAVDAIRSLPGDKSTLEYLARFASVRQK